MNPLPSDVHPDVPVLFVFLRYKFAKFEHFRIHVAIPPTPSTLSQMTSTFHQIPPLLAIHHLLPIFVERLMPPTNPACPKSKDLAGDQGRAMLSQHSCSMGRCTFGVEYMWCKITDRKSTRLNSSHQIISYAVFC